MPRFSRVGGKKAYIRALSAIGVLAGYAPDASISGPCTPQLSSCVATKFIMMVLMTSLMSRRARSHPQIPPHIAPPAAPAISRIRIAIGRGHPPRYGPIAPAAIAPATSCPSAPIFQSAPENETDIASPVKIRGVARTIVSVSAYQLPKAPSASAAKTPIGEAPRASSTPAIIAAARRSAVAALANELSITARGVPSTPVSRHQHTELLCVAFAITGLAHSAAADDEQAPARFQQLIEVTRYQQHRAACGREIRESPMHIGGAREIEAAADIVRHDDLGRGRHRARNLEALPISA